MFLSGFAVTVLHRRFDAFGDPLDEASGTTVPDCGLLQHSTSEDASGGEQVTETATLATPAEADIHPTDVVLFPDGSRWHVAGRAHVPHSPLSGWEPAQVVPLKRVTG